MNIVKTKYAAYLIKTPIKKLPEFLLGQNLVGNTNTSIHVKEILFVKVNHCSDADIEELFRISKVFGAAIIDYDGAIVLLECTQTESRNNDLIVLLKRRFVNRIEIVRGGSVAVEAVGISER